MNVIILQIGTRLLLTFMQLYHRQNHGLELIAAANSMENNTASKYDIKVCWAILLLEIFQAELFQLEDGARQNMMN